MICPKCEGVVRPSYLDGGVVICCCLDCYEEYQLVVQKWYLEPVE